MSFFGTKAEVRRMEESIWMAALAVATGHLSKVHADSNTIIAATQLVLLGDLVAAPSRCHSLFYSELKKLQEFDGAVAEPRFRAVLKARQPLQLCATANGAELTVYSATEQPGKLAYRLEVPPSGNELLPHHCLCLLVIAGYTALVHGTRHNLPVSFAGRDSDWIKLMSVVVNAAV